jgi:hypothetical protein
VVVLNHFAANHFSADHFITLGSLISSSVVVPTTPNNEEELLLARIRRNRRGSSRKDGESAYDLLRNLVVQVSLESANIPGIEQLWSIHGHAEQTFIMRAKDNVYVLAENVTPKGTTEEIRIEAGMVFIK